MFDDGGWHAGVIAFHLETYIIDKFGGAYRTDILHKRIDTRRFVCILGCLCS